MPRWGVQSLVNGWVNVNEKHVVYEKDQNQAAASASGEAPKEPPPPLSSSSEHNNNNNHQQQQDSGHQHPGRRRNRQRQQLHWSAQHAGKQQQPARPQYPSPVVGDGRAILDSRRGGGYHDAAHDDGKWGPLHPGGPLGMSPESSPMLPPAASPSQSAAAAGSASATSSSGSRSSRSRLKSKDAVAAVAAAAAATAPATPTATAAKYPSSTTIATADLTNGGDSNPSTASMLSLSAQAGRPKQYSGSGGPPATATGILSSSSSPVRQRRQSGTSDAVGVGVEGGGSSQYSESVAGDGFVAGGELLQSSSRRAAGAPPPVSTSTSPHSHHRRKRGGRIGRTNSQSDMLKMMAAGPSSANRPARKSDAFLRHAHEVQAQQRQRELWLQQQKAGQEDQQGVEHRPTGSTAKADSSTSGSLTVAHSNANAVEAGTGGGGGGGGGKAGWLGMDSDSASIGEDSSLHKFVSGFLGMGSIGGDNDDKSERRQQRRQQQQQKQSPPPVESVDTTAKKSSTAPDETPKAGPASAPPSSATMTATSAGAAAAASPSAGGNGVVVVSGFPPQCVQRQPTPPYQDPASMTTGQYLNEAAFVQQHAQRQQALSAARSVASNGTGRASRRSRRTSGRRRSDHRSDDGSESRHGDGRRSDGGGREQDGAGAPAAPVNYAVGGTNGNYPTAASAPQHHQGLYPGGQQQHHPQASTFLPNYGGPLPSHLEDGYVKPSPSTTPDGGGAYYGGPQQRRQFHPPPPSSGPGMAGRAAADGGCSHCDEMQRQVLALQADLDYLRGVVLQNEFVCAECESGGAGLGHHHQPPGIVVGSSGASVASSKHSVSSASRRSKKKAAAAAAAAAADPTKPQESEALTEASIRLLEVTARHKRQIESMTRETARWQNDMHLKLSKFSMMCKDLNDESAKRKDEALAVQSSLANVRSERNALLSEVEALKARVALYEKEDVEKDRISEVLRDGENAMLDRADDAIQQRDALITNLSSRLRRTLDTLEIERRQQRQRRQIIFPSKRSNSYNMATASSSPFFYQQSGGGATTEEKSDAELVQELREQLGMAQDAAKIAEMSLDTAVTEASRKEETLQARCDELTRELREAQGELLESTEISKSAEESK